MLRDTDAAGPPLAEAPLGDIDALTRRVDPDRWLSSRYVADPERRADLIALYAYDHEITRAPRVVSTPLLGEIRLAWWRETLDEIYAGGRVRRHPAADALALAVRRRALPREFLETPLDARYDDLEPRRHADEASLNAWLDAAYGAVAGGAARLLDPAADPHAVQAAARAWGLSLLGSDGLPDGFNASSAIDAHLRASRKALVALSPAAFPAVAHATLARRPQQGALAKRLRLSWAVVRGQL